MTRQSVFRFGLLYILLVAIISFHDTQAHNAGKRSGHSHDALSHGNADTDDVKLQSQNSHADGDVISDVSIFPSGGSSHDHADSSDVTPDGDRTSKVFLQEIFTKYGENGKMTYEGFEHLLVNLGLGNVWIDDHDVHDHHTGDGFNEFHDDHTHNLTKHDSKEQRQQRHEQGAEGLSVGGGEDQDEASTVREDNGGQIGARKGRTVKRFVKIRDKNQRGERKDAHHRKTRRHAAQESTKKCLSPQEILQAAHIRLSLGGIGPSEFSRALCPAIVYQLDAHVCHSHEPCHQAVHHESRAAHCSIYHHCKDGEGHEGGVNNRTLQGMSGLERLLAIPGKVWGMALIAVTVISLCGLCSVAIIPIMDRLFYNQLIQFLIALAVGTLTGDALLHLLPHAMLPHSDNADDGHSEGETHNDDEEVRLIWNGLTVLCGIYFFFLMERLVAMFGAWKKKRAARRKLSQKLKEVGESLTPDPMGSSEGDDVTDNKDKHSHRHHQQQHLRHHHHHHDSGDHDDEEQRLESSPSFSEESTEMTMMQVDFPQDKGSHEGEGHSEGHHKGHGHSHGHSVPGSVGAAAWMVIMGDGLHNFTDGLAIGASFASSISVGLSTSVAVFCHELPHELGDFAVLLKSGMSVKQALVYNVVSSVLCLAGMIIGLLLGNVDSASVWIFTITAGIFIYIALVDMLPEMTGSTREVDLKGAMVTLLLHSVGIASGISVMLIIALFEDHIQLLAGEKL